jgi:hypothetical protein
MTTTTRYSLLAVFLLILVGCEDPVPDDYVEEIAVQGFVIAEQPLTDIRVFRTLPIQDTFTFAKAVITDAIVTVTENGVPVAIEFVDDSTGGYYRAVDTSYRVKYNTTYGLMIQARGKTLTATAQTRGPFNWVRPPKDTIIYPGKANETQIFDSLNISWQGQEGTNVYVLALECLDTLGYGAYLLPPTADTNRRLRDPSDEFDDGTLIANELTRYVPAIVSNTPVVWRTFKWFGRHQLHVYTGDGAFQEWFNMVGFGRRSNYDYRLSNVTGGLGVWAGASKISGDLFLVKDKP